MVNQIAELQKKICNLERDIEVILLHSIEKNAVTLSSTNPNVCVIVEQIEILRRSQQDDVFLNELLHEIEILPIGAHSKSRLRTYITTGATTKKNIIINEQKEEQK